MGILLTYTRIDAEAKALQRFDETQQHQACLHGVLAIGHPRRTVEFDLLTGRAELILRDDGANGLAKGADDGICEVCGRRVDDLELVGLVERDAQPIARRRKAWLSSEEERI
jgi:hypothetical protein